MTGLYYVNRYMKLLFYLIFLKGSAADTVVYVVGRPYYQSWQPVYTAVTRGIRKVIIVHSPISLHQAIRRRPVERQTKLEEDLKQAMPSQVKQSGHKRKHPESSPPKTPPHVKQQPSCSSVSPLTQQAANTHQAGWIPAQCDSTCRVCKKTIHRDMDTIKCVREGASGYWIHASCGPSCQL